MTDENKNENDLRLLDEQLVAYLDGEIDDAERRRIEEWLARDENIRRRLKEMEQTWSLLDDLDPVPADRQFVQSTLEMVAVAAGKDAEQFLTDAPRRRWQNRLAVLAGVVTALLAGYGATTLLWPNPNRELVNDLSVLENLDRYRPIGDIEFLRQLQKQKLFTKQEDDTPIEPDAHAGESPAQRLARLEKMDQAERQKIARLEERFLSLDSDQQQQLRQLGAAMQTDPDASELWQVMGRYDDWLMTLPLFTRAELTDMPTADRIQAVEKHLRNELARGERRALTRHDAEVLLTWMRGLVAQNEPKLLESMPPVERKRMADAAPPMRQMMLSWQMWQSAGPGRPPALLTESDLNKLQSELSPKARERLASKSINDQWQQVAGWLRHLLWQRPNRNQLSTADDRQLADFFENQLNDEQRDRLLSMPAEEMQRELLQMYQRRIKMPEGPNFFNNRRLPPSAPPNTKK
jgi:hypothetical protein